MNKPVRIAVLDSGVHLTHPHIGGVIGGKDCTETIPSAASFPECCIDRLGHGTAVTALIHHLAPQAELLAVRIFHRQLITSLPTVLRAIRWSFEQKIDLLNLSFGTTNTAYQGAFKEILDEAKERKALVISPWESGGINVFPGGLKGAIGVVADTASAEDSYRVLCDTRGVRYAAAPYPRPIPGLPREKNLNGVSFATASITGQIARLWQHHGPQEDWPGFLRARASMS